MSAGTGITHSENEKNADCKLFQIWIYRIKISSPHIIKFRLIILLEII